MNDEPIPLGYTPCDLGQPLTIEEIFAIPAGPERDNEWRRATVILHRESLKRPSAPEIMTHFAHERWHLVREILQDIQNHPIDGNPDAAAEIENILDQLRERF